MTFRRYIPGLCQRVIRQAFVPSGVLAISFGSSLSGQSQHSVDTLDVRLATITTDTGAFAPGHRDFSRYTDPGLCLAATEMTRASVQLPLAARVDQDNDTVGIGAAASIVRACTNQWARFPLASAKARDLYDLLLLSTYTESDTLTEAIVGRLGRGISPSALLGLFLQRRRLAEIQKLMTQIDAKGAGSGVTRLDLHAQLMNYYAGRPADTTRLRLEIASVLRLGDSVPWERQILENQLEAYALWIGLTVWTHPDSVSGLVAQAMHVLDRDRSKLGPQDPEKGWTVTDLFNELVPKWYTYQSRGGGVPAPRLTAQFWYPPPGRSAGDTVVPVPGKINLICAGGEMVDNEDDQYFTSAGIQAVHLRRWLARYGPDRLAVTLVYPAANYGFFAVSHLYTWQLFSTPEEAARLWRWYWQEYAKLPVTVAVQAQQDDWLPAPDGRRWRESRLQFNDFWQHDPSFRELLSHYDAGPNGEFTPRPAELPGACVIVGRDGKVADIPQNRQWSVLDKALSWLFHEQQ